MKPVKNTLDFPGIPAITLTKFPVGWEDLLEFDFSGHNHLQETLQC